MSQADNLVSIDSMVKIERMNENHIPQIALLEKMCAAIPWTEEMFRDELKSNLANYFVALVGDKVVAYAGMWIVLFEGQITNILVHPDYRRRGIGDMLLCKFEEIAMEYGLSELTLEVRISNETAIRLYDKHGFKKVGFRKQYYEDNKEDAALMTKKMIYDE